MSEYQYYEFQAIDRPLTRQEQAEVRVLSTRATITATWFVNVYHWGDFKGNPLALMERYYDAFLYVANWGSHHLMLRLPRAVLDPAAVRPYVLRSGPLSLHTNPDHLVLAFESETDEPEDADEGEGWLATLVPLRADIAAGDRRALYLGWLLAVQEGFLDADVTEPPLPPGLGEPSGPLQALAAFLRIDGDLLQSASEGSPAMREAIPSREEAEQWLGAAPDAEKADLLLRLACGEVDARLLQAEVRRRIRGTGAAQGDSGGDGRRRTVDELMAGAARRRQEREEREARERERRRQEEVAARAAYLDHLAGRQEEVWQQVEALVGAKRPAEYGEAVRLLLDLRDVAEWEQQAQEFTTRLTDLRIRNARKVSFLERLDRAGLRPDVGLPG